MAQPELSVAEFASKAGEAAALLKALANETRLMVLCTLVGGEHSVSELQDACNLSQSALSQHLARLRDEGLVATRREAQSIYYRLDDPMAASLLATLAALYCPPKRKRK